MKKLKNVLILFTLLIITFLSCLTTSKAETEDEVELVRQYTSITNTETTEEDLEEQKLKISSLTPDVRIEKEYYRENDTNTKVIRIYEALNEDNKLILKYETLNDEDINREFNTFQDENGKKYKFYLLENNEVARGLLKINNKYYAFDREGRMLYGWQVIDNKTYYFNTTSGEAYIGMKTINGKTYYFNSIGQKVLGLIRHNNSYYYMYEGYYLKNNFKTISGKQYYFNKYGQAVKGIQTINNKKYFFNPTTCVRQDGLITYGRYKWYIKNGTMSKSKWKTISGKQYYFDKYGHAVRGIKTIKKKKYYFSTTTYARQDGLITYGGYKWYIKKGKIYKKKWKTVKGKKYYFNKKGHAVRGIKTIKKKKYYFNTTTYARQDGLITYGGYKWYIKKGKIYKSKWKTVKGKKYYFNKKGHAVRGIKTIKKKVYYFNTKTYARQAGFISYNGKYYYIASGKMYKSCWISFGSNMKYFSSNGTAYVNRTVTIKSTAYNFNSVGNVTHGYFKSGSETYYKDAYGRLVTGYRVIYGKNKFFSDEGILMATLKNVIDVSYAQGTINWSKVKSSGKVNGVILRLGFTGYGKKKSLNTDDYFVKNLNELKRLKIPYGVYYWGFARDTKKGIQEANHVLNVLRTNKAKPTYGVYYDAEIGGAARENNNYWALSESEYKLAAPAFMNTIKAAGYKAGIYSNADSFFGKKKTTYNSKKTRRSTYGYLNNSTIKKYPMWVAHYNSKCSSHYGQKCGYTKYYGWQYTSSGSVPGISGRVDFNFWYRT